MCNVEVGMTIAFEVWDLKVTTWRNPWRPAGTLIFPGRAQRRDVTAFLCWLIPTLPGQGDLPQPRCSRIKGKMVRYSSKSSLMLTWPEKQWKPLRAGQREPAPISFIMITVKTAPQSVQSDSFFHSAVRGAKTQQTYCFKGPVCRI